MEMSGGLKKEGLRKSMDLYSSFNVASTSLGLLTAIPALNGFTAFGKSIPNYGQYAVMPETPKRIVFLG